MSPSPSGWPSGAGCYLHTIYSLSTHYLRSVGGLLGVLCGMGLSVLLRPRLPWIDPVICGTSLLVSNIYTISTHYLHYLLYVQVSLPILIGGVLIARNMILPSFIIICLGMIFLNFNWSVSVDMTMWVTC